MRKIFFSSLLKSVNERLSFGIAIPFSFATTSLPRQPFSLKNQSGTTEVKIPNWFLREKGCLGREVVANEKGIAIPKLNLSLTLFKSEEKNIFRIGSFNYFISSHFIDFQQLLIDPLLWIGNIELTAFTGNSIIQWHRQIKE